MLYANLFTKSCNDSQTHLVPISKLSYVHTEHLYETLFVLYNTIKVGQLQEFQRAIQIHLGPSKLDVFYHRRFWHGNERTLNSHTESASNFNTISK